MMHFNEDLLIFIFGLGSAGSTLEERFKSSHKMFNRNNNVYCEDSHGTIAALDIMLEHGTEKAMCILLALNGSEQETAHNNC